MKAIQIPDKLYDKLKDCVVDPLDDTPELVISRLIDLVEKVIRSGSVSWEAPVAFAEQHAASQNGRSGKGRYWRRLNSYYHARPSA